MIATLTAGSRRCAVWIAQIGSSVRTNARGRRRRFVWEWLRMTAKEMLMRYLYAVREAREMELQIAKLRLKYAAPSAIKYSDMPTSHDANHDLSDYAARLDELTDMLVKRYSKCIGIEIDIESRLERMPEDKQVLREILRHRYLTITDEGKLNHWEDVGKAVGYTDRRAQTLHGIALLYFPTD